MNVSAVTGVVGKRIHGSNQNAAFYAVSKLLSHFSENFQYVAQDQRGMCAAGISTERCMPPPLSKSVSPLFPQLCGINKSDKNKMVRNEKFSIFCPSQSTIQNFSFYCEKYCKPLQVQCTEMDKKVFHMVQPQKILRNKEQ